MTKKLLLIGIVIFLLFLQFSFSYAGILVSDSASREYSQKSTSSDPKINQMIREYVQQVVVYSVIQKVERIMRNAITKNKLQIFPQIAYESIQQASLQVFKQPETKKIAEKAFKKSYDKAIKLKDEGVSHSTIDSKVRVNVDRILKALDAENVFRQIIEQVLDQGLHKHQQIIVMTIAQRQAQLIAIQQKYRQIQQAMQQQLQSAIIRQKQKAAQYMQDQQVQAAQNQYEQQMYEEYKNQVSKYEQAMEQQYNNFLQQYQSLISN